VTQRNEPESVDGQPSGRPSASKGSKAVSGVSGRSRRGVIFRRLWQAIGWFLVAVVVWLSLTPNPPEPPAILAWDKAQHVVTYAALMLWFRQAFARHWRWPLFLILLGVGLEIGQGFTEWRMLEPFDMFANTAGVGIGLALARTPLGAMLAALTPD
jgi:VanZ family protein